MNDKKGREVHVGDEGIFQGRQKCVVAAIFRDMAHVLVCEGTGGHRMRIPCDEGEEDEIDHKLVSVAVCEARGRLADSYELEITRPKPRQLDLFGDQV